MPAAHPPWLKYALTQVGYHEGANNDNKFARDLRGVLGEDLNHEPWCDLFVDDSCEKSDHPLPPMQPGMKHGAAAVSYSINFAKSHNLWIPSWQAKPGDQICYGWQGPNSPPAEMHTGFIVSSGPAGSTGHTVEGNRADQVERQTFTVGESVVLGCIDLNRLLLGREKIRVKPVPTKAKPTPQPRSPHHPHNTGPLHTHTEREGRKLIKQLNSSKRHVTGKDRHLLHRLIAAAKRRLHR